MTNEQIKKNLIQDMKDDVVKDLNELEVYEKYQVDEMMQDIEIMRVE